MTRPLLTLTNVGKTFCSPDGKRVAAVRNISLKIRQGEFFVLLGPSGSGKSTLLRIMSGLEQAHEGTVSFARGVTAQDMAFVFQQFALLPWLTVRQNIEFGLLSRGVDADERRKKSMRVMRRLGLSSFADVSPRELSGGLRQRVGIARALVVEPKIIFMDEPFSELDSFTAEDLRKEVLRIWSESGVTIVMVTHLISEAIELADRIAVLTPRPASIERMVVNTIPRPRTLRSPEAFRLEDLLYRLVKP